MEGQDVLYAGHHVPKGSAGALCDAWTTNAFILPSGAAVISALPTNYIWS